MNAALADNRRHGYANIFDTGNFRMVAGNRQNGIFIGGDGLANPT